MRAESRAWTLLLAGLTVPAGCAEPLCPSQSLEKGSWYVESANGWVVPDGVSDATAEYGLDPRVPERIVIQYVSEGEPWTVEMNLYRFSYPFHSTQTGGDECLGSGNVVLMKVSRNSVDADVPLHELFWSDLQYTCGVGETSFFLSGVPCNERDGTARAPRVDFAWDGPGG